MKGSIADVLRVKVLIPIVLSGLMAWPGRSQDVSIPRVEAMPRFPSPYHMRDWKDVARRYDAFVFDEGRTGQYLPLVFSWPVGINYPNHAGFGLDSYVGTNREEAGEAINVLPALVGATLAGVDKRDHYGRDWVLMAEDYFNNRPEEDVYLNNPSAASGSDWWYETMPNVFFYQLYDLYGNVGAFDHQFRRVAERWLEAIWAMGASAAPWTLPDMNHRAWALSTMTPNDAGVPEPEAAGAIGWLLYAAYLRTGEESFRQGAEWAMEFLDGLGANPAYELQLEYGAVLAARMNAELDTGYDLEKILNWCFEVGSLRGWGTILGTWGGYDVAGLVGEAGGASDYGFAMNTFQRLAALMPVARYDDRFARLLGRYALNATNAARLFYTAFLPDSLQDSDTWARIHDPHSVLAHEAIRQYRFGRSPYATGDAIDGGWASTNLALYGSSHVGYLAAVVDTTDVPYVLQLDVTATAFFDEAYPTYLFYNPYEQEVTVSFDAGPGASDLYELTTDRFIAEGISGTMTLSIAPDHALLVAVTPTGGVRTTEGGTLLIDGVAVDFRTGGAIGNRPPRIKALAAGVQSIAPGDTVRVYCTSVDPDDDPLTVVWSAEAGSIDGEGAEADWVAPAQTGEFGVACRVSDAGGLETSATLDLSVTKVSTLDVKVEAADRKVDLGGATRLTCTSGSSSDALEYGWTVDDGALSGSGSEVDWTAPEVEGAYTIACRVTGDAAEEGSDSLVVYVRDFSAGESGPLLVHLPLDGDAADASAFERVTSLSGAVVAPDARGRSGRALRFDGADDHVRVANAEDLNFGEGITVALWMRVDRLLDREAFVASHGSWENRWKLSIADGRLRWTIKTDRGIRDVDTEPLEAGRFYHVVARYDGRDFEVYLDGRLSVLDAFEGLIQPTTHDLMLAQRLPADRAYNFAGVLDDFRLYGAALPVADVYALHAQATPLAADTPPGSDGIFLEPGFPNPFEQEVTIGYRIGLSGGEATLRVVDVLGRTVRRWERLPAGSPRQMVVWDGRNDAGSDVAAGFYLVELRQDGRRVSAGLIRRAAR